MWGRSTYHQRVDMLTSFDEWFSGICRSVSPWEWQRDLATDSTFHSRSIRIPTGFGKTAGVFSAWAWNRLVREDDSWPRRLVWCLPMRVLTEQIAAEVRRFLDASGRSDIPVVTLMGGVEAGDWHIHPEREAVLVGTQDMLLSRALNRGYGAARARWPMDFGLLNHDALWVMDEIQLMDVGLATSAQIQAFREMHAKRSMGRLRPCGTWWMSATQQAAWLESVDTKAMLADLPARTEIPAASRQGGLWGVRKSVRIEPCTDDKSIAKLILERHEQQSLTLVVLNRVESAISVFDALEKLAPTADLRLVHSRFRPTERAKWREEFLDRSGSIPDGGRILVATQVVEAGVDISAKVLLTDLAPWSSLVQRFGRCARYPGETGSVTVLDRGWTEKSEKNALPYDIQDLLRAKQELEGLNDVSPASLEAHEEGLDNDTRARLYPYKPRHLLLEQDWIDLFDTSPDLSGADLDISRFIRSGEENDCLVFWREIPAEGPDDSWKPTRDELCPVPVHKAQEWLCGSKKERHVKTRTVGGKSVKVGWVWDWVDGRWKSRTERGDLLPGRIVLVDAVFGGYSQERGWDPDSKPVHIVPGNTLVDPQGETDGAEERETLSQARFKTIATHGGEVAQVAEEIGHSLGLLESVLKVLVLAGRWHDIGKLIDFFQSSIEGQDRPDRRDLAKAPKDHWPRKSLYRHGGEHRLGLRHELASMLAMFSVLTETDPGHQALDPRPGLTWSEEDGIIAWEPMRGPSKWERDLHLLTASEFNLAAYLVLSHHGKVRTSLQASPKDQEFVSSVHDDRGMPIRGIRNADTMPALHGDKGESLVGPTTLSLEPAHLGLSETTGPSWTERVQCLLEIYGPSALAWLEALLRAADIRASRLETPDPLLETMP